MDSQIISPTVKSQREDEMPKTIVDDKNDNNKEFHGIIINISQKNKSIFKTVDIVGKRKYLFGFLTLYKVNVSSDKIADVIKAFQRNMAGRIVFKKQEFYCHFYRDNELIIVFRDEIFNVSPDKSTWVEAIAYGRQLKIADKQLDFVPNRFEDENF
jgi:hypothetical protein